MAGTEFYLGMDGKIYLGASGTTGVPTTELENVKDVKVTLQAGSADITTRKNKGWRSKVPTLKECTIEFGTLWLESDVQFKQLLTAFLTNKTVKIAALTKTNGSGPVGEFSVTNCSRGEELEEGISADVTLELFSFDQWKEATP